MVNKVTGLSVDSWLNLLNIVVCFSPKSWTETWNKNKQGLRNWNVAWFSVLFVHIDRSHKLSVVHLRPGCIVHGSMVCAIFGHSALFLVSDVCSMHWLYESFFVICYLTWLYENFVVICYLTFETLETVCDGEMFVLCRANSSLIAWSFRPGRCFCFSASTVAWFVHYHCVLNGWYLSAGLRWCEVLWHVQLDLWPVWPSAIYSNTVYLHAVFSSSRARSKSARGPVRLHPGKPSIVVCCGAL